MYVPLYVKEMEVRGKDMLNKNKIGKYLFTAFRAILIISLGYIVLYPLLYMISSSFTPASQAADPSVVWVPKTFSLENFMFAFAAMDYVKSLWVTLSIEILSGLIEVFTCAVIAYGFARYNFKFKNIIFALVIVTIIVPPQAIIVPMYLNYSYVDFLGILKLIGNAIGQELRPNFLDTGWTFYIPSIFGVGLRSGLFIFIYRQFFIGLPAELEEAASIDGAGPIKTFLRVALPSSGVAIVCVTIFSIIWHWNDYNLSAMFLSENFPLSVKLSMLADNTFTTASGINFTASGDIVMAACILFVLPVLLFYIIVQKKFVQSIDRVGIVG